MKAVILAAGEGTRLGPFTYTEPKVMIPVANRPILQYVVEALVRTGVRDVVMVVGYKRERIQTYFEDGKKFGCHIEYAVQRKELGTVHALLEARGHVTGDFLVLPGDNVIDDQAVADLTEDRSGTSILITETDAPSRYGEVTLDGPYLAQITEKPRERVSNLINTGIYAFHDRVFQDAEAVVASGKHDIPDLIQALAKGSKVRAILTRGTWIDAVYPWDLLRVNAKALQWSVEGIAGKVEQGVVVKGRVSIGDGSVVRSGTYLQGPLVIGKGCDIGPSVTLQGATALGDNVRVGASSVIEESIVMKDTSLRPGAYISHSVLGKGVTAGAHFTAAPGRANLRVEGEWHEVEEAGAFVGEDTQMGNGVLAEPGVVIGAGCRVASGARLRGHLPAMSIVM